MAELKPEDIFETYGAFNDLTAGSKTPTAGRNTLSTTEALSAVLEKHYTPDVLAGRSVYDGVIMASIGMNAPILQSTQALIEYLSDPPEEIINFAYKVYIPEVEPRCISFSDRNTPPGSFTNAQRVMTLPTATINTDEVDGVGNARAIAPGTYVKVVYGNAEKFKNPEIISIGKKVIELGGMMQQKGSLKAKFSKKRGTAYAGGNNTGGAGSSWGSTPSQRQMMDEASRLKDIRKQIFEDDTNTWKDARGGAPGPFAKKANRKWTSNAILSSADQTALKKLHQAKINKVAANLGMKVATLEKIFKKESGTFDPYAINHNTSATGLIQFMPEFSSAGTAKSLGTTVEELLTMGPDKQLDYVEKYFKKNKRASSNWEEVDWYFVVFYPSAIGKDDSYVLGNASTAEVNPGYAEVEPNPNAGLITRRRVKEKWMA
tara:strand:+ start:12823 stop:14118 length:1296 start_codon:yes stop_codon:yes gene_type:complete